MRLPATVGLFFVALLIEPPAKVRSAAAETYPEYRVKAAFLYNFAKFTEWPPEAFPAKTTPFVLCVLGDDPFGSDLDEIVAGRRVAGRNVVVRRPASVGAADGCHIIFVAYGEPSMLKTAFEQLRRTSVLTVGETDAFSRHGGCIRFLLVGGDRKVRFEINVAAADAARLKLSSKLLKLARTVVTASGKNGR